MINEPRRTTADADRLPEAKGSRSSEVLDDQAFLSYSRQLLLQDIGVDGQQRLQAATVLLARLGGLGSPAVLYLAAAATCPLRDGWRATGLTSRLRAPIWCWIVAINGDPPRHQCRLCAAWDPPN